MEKIFAVDSKYQKILKEIWGYSGIMSFIGWGEILAVLPVFDEKIVTK